MMFSIIIALSSIYSTSIVVISTWYQSLVTILVHFLSYVVSSFHWRLSDRLFCVDFHSVSHPWIYVLLMIICCVFGICFISFCFTGLPFCFALLHINSLAFRWCRISDSFKHWDVSNILFSSFSKALFLHFCYQISLLLLLKLHFCDSSYMISVMPPLLLDLKFLHLLVSYSVLWFLVSVHSGSAGLIWWFLICCVGIYPLNAFILCSSSFVCFVV